MPVTTRSAKRNSGPKLPFDIQLCVLEWMIALGKADSSVDVSPCAAVCKSWQVIIERELFRHLTLTLKDLDLFGKYCHGRKHYVKHIVLEIWLCHDLDSNLDKVCFTEATETLFVELSTWEGHGITLEFGIVPPSEPGWISYPKRSRRFHIHYGPVPRKRSLSGNLRDLHELKEFDWDGDRDLTNDDLSELWTEHGLDIQGHEHLAFHDDSDVGTSLLAKVACVSKLLIRRRYMPNISSHSLSTIIKSLPSLESIQLERWCYGRHLYDDKWDSDLDNTTIALPESLKEFTYYEECGTNYHQRDGEEPHRLNPMFKDVLIKAADRIEHIAISFSASSLLNPNADFKFTALKTLAMTSNALLHDMDGLVDLPLLRCAATAAKRMPKLEVFEIWCYKNGMALQAQVFTYQRLGKYSSCITWKENRGPRKISERLQRAWKEVADGENGIFEVKYEFLTLEWTLWKRITLGEMRSHLLLGNRILHDITWTQV
ncbi:uncharacterized protein B0J16DRAFT_145704 [Fusarium flagelliforme]|uniref:uncharacterized protein n=1 Tax=Fusarium flagelliforme TaxID=2675880 RepID=UPI001E8CBF4F|nr:uncharacterized protein B0J16DRAFT_145704 [Fusarium flagelliforme]KAH7186013.1 hypothetical protein B0J16DRAFT_145704 [Fusarium flagelliforme]